jgi:cardiolipin synthase (CMP-forming)
MNLPNILTTLRLLLIPVFIYVFFFFENNNLLYATGVFFLAGLTDGLDGYLARKYQQVTKIGQALDPLADKLMQLTVIVSFTIAEILPLWILIVVGIKEGLMILGAAILYTRRDKTVIPANKLGKVSTVLFYVAILLIGLDVYLGRYLLITAILITVIAFFRYLRMGLKKLNETKAVK